MTTLHSCLQANQGKMVFEKAIDVHYFYPSNYSNVKFSKRELIEENVNDTGMDLIRIRGEDRLGEKSLYFLGRWDENDPQNEKGNLS